MVENNEELKLGIGTEEAVSLKPAVVKVGAVRFQEVGEKKAKKLVITAIHPDRKEEPIEISSVKYEFRNKLEIAGLWKNLDSKGLIRKGSALAVLLQKYGCNSPEQLVGKDIPTIQDDKGYLVLKAY
jgi:hypothetical protein